MHQPADLLSGELDHRLIPPRRVTLSPVRTQLIVYVLPVTGLWTSISTESPGTAKYSSRTFLATGDDVVGPAETRSPQSFIGTSHWDFHSSYELGLPHATPSQSAGRTQASISRAVDDRADTSTTTSSSAPPALACCHRAARYRRAWPSPRELIGEVFEYIEAFYNPASGLREQHSELDRYESRRVAARVPNERSTEQTTTQPTVSAQAGALHPAIEPPQGRMTVGA
jgi:hypothetical protein